MKLIKHVNNPMSPRWYRILRFFHLTPDYMVESDKVISICFEHNGRIIKTPLIRDANVMDLAGKVGEAAGKIFEGAQWDLYTFQRRHRGAIYSGVTAQRR